MKLIALFVASLLGITQPAKVPIVVNAPGALTQNPIFVSDGGPGSAPPVTIFPLIAPSFQILSGGTAAADVALDGGQLPGQMVHERGRLTATTMPQVINLRHLYATIPFCTCTLVDGSTKGSLVKLCKPVQDAGVLPWAQLDAGLVTTVRVDTQAEDGGSYIIDCEGW